MASLGAHLADLLIRVQVKRRLGDMQDLARVKAVFEGGRLPTPPGVTFRAATLGGVPGEWAEAEGGGEAAATLFYVHGGGFIACSPRTHRPITGWYARHGFRVFAPDYRLAPQHRFPAAVDDVVASWRALRNEVDGPLAVSGESAGGNLALALMLSLRDAGETLPGAAALFSPSTDMAGTGQSMRANVRRDAMFAGDKLGALVHAYLGDTDPCSPLASPLYADLAGLPPLLIHVGEREVLRDDSVQLAERVRAAGGVVELKVWPVVPHAWQLAHQAVPEGRQSLQEAAGFLRRAGGAEGPARAGALQEAERPAR